MSDSKTPQELLNKYIPGAIDFEGIKEGDIIDGELVTTKSITGNKIGIYVIDAYDEYASITSFRNAKENSIENQLITYISPYKKLEDED